MARGAFGGVQVQLSARPRSRSMLVEVSGPSGTASNTLRPKRLPIHIGSAGERARPPVQSFFVLDQMNRTEPNRKIQQLKVSCCSLGSPLVRVLRGWETKRSGYEWRGNFPTGRIKANLQNLIVQEIKTNRSYMLSSKVTRV
jgi:hypothetical protein